MKKVLVLMACIETAGGWAQESSDYIITAAGEKIVGDIGVLLGDKNPRTIKFRKSSKANYTRLKPGDVKEFVKSGIPYKSAVVDVDTSLYKLSQLTTEKDPGYMKDSVFLKVLVRGEKSLFQLIDQKGKMHFFIDDHGIKPLVRRQYIIWYYRMANYEKRLAENTKYKGQLKNYLEGCDRLGKKIEGMLYLKKDFVMIFKEYHKCTNAPHQVY